MTYALFLALVLLAGAGATQNELKTEKIIGDINIADIIAAIMEIVNSLPDIIAGLLPNLPAIIEIIRDIISRVPEIIANLPNVDWAEVIASLPGNLPEIVATIVEFIAEIVEIIRNVDIDWEAIFDLLPPIDISVIIGNISQIIAALPDIIANLPEIIANLPEIIADLPAIIERIREILENLPEIDWEAIINLLPSIDRDSGVQTVIEAYPSLVQVECGIGSVWVQCCAASILNTGYVLSSARCFSGNLFNIGNRRIRAGTTTRGRGGQVYPVSFAINHPTFGENGRDGDLSIVRIMGFFFYGPTIQRIPIVSQGVAYPAGLTIMHAGWGSTAQGSVVASRELFSADMVVTNHDECSAIYQARLLSRAITSNMICFGRPQTRGRRSDLRDTGAPLYLQGALIGIQSFGSYVNRTVPIVATSVSSYSNWIVSTAT